MDLDLEGPTSTGSRPYTPPAATMPMRRAAQQQALGQARQRAGQQWHWTAGRMSSRATQAAPRRDPTTVLRSEAGVEALYNAAPAGRRSHSKAGRLKVGLIQSRRQRRFPETGAPAADRNGGFAASQPVRRKRGMSRGPRMNGACWGRNGEGCQMAGAPKATGSVSVIVGLLLGAFGPRRQGVSRCERGSPADRRPVRAAQEGWRCGVEGDAQNGRHCQEYGFHQRSPGCAQVAR